MNSHQFTGSKLYLLKSAVCDFRQTDIADIEAASDESTTREITAGKVAIHKITIFILSFGQRFCFKIGFGEVFRFDVVGHYYYFFLPVLPVVPVPCP
jgi:hypothetical protein